MDIKEFLPFLIFAAIALIRGLSEANKTKKHTKAPSSLPNEGDPKWSSPAGKPTSDQGNTPHQKVGPPPVKKSPFDVLMEEFMEMPSKTAEQPAESQYKRNYQEPRVEKPVVMVEKNEIKVSKTQTDDLKNIEQLPEEVIRARAAHQKHAHKFEAYKEHSEYADFDLEDAIVKAAILERYQF